MKFKYKILTVLLVVLFASCSDDFLDRQSEESLTTDVFFKTQADFESAVNGIYSPLRGFYNAQNKNGTWVPPNLLIGDMHSDNARYYYNPDYRAIGDNEDYADFIPGSQLFSGYWNTWYVWISNANQVITRIDDENIEWDDSSAKDNLKGQALFMRSWCYWQLSQFYGDACIHLEPVSTVDQTSMPLSDEAEVIAQAKTDAASAVELLPDKANQESGRVTSGTATMLLAEIAIYGKDYATAETLLKSLSNDYSLMANYADVFDPANKNNQESIFEIQYDGSSNTYSSNFFYPMTPYPMSKEVMAELTGATNATDLAEGEGYCIPSPNLISAYETGDKRFTSTIKDVTNAKGAVVPTCIKYLHKHSTYFQADENMPIWRYSEALLYLAEALNEQGAGKQVEAMIYVNMVRNRAELANNTTATSQEQVREAILKERRIELAFEGKRFWDLVRFNKVEEVISAYGASVRADQEAYYLPAGIPVVPSAFTDFRTKFNIPDGEKLYNPNIGGNE